MRIPIVALAVAALASCQSGGTSNTASSSPSSPAQTGSAGAAFARSTKGWNLFSWQEGGAWYFSLTAGTNATKSWSQITGKSPGDPQWDAPRLAGAAALRAAVERLPKGEQVHWVMPGEPVADDEARSKLAAPPADVRKDIAALCAARGVTID